MREFKRNGAGILIKPHGERLEGAFENDLPSGICQIYYNNGDYFIGSLREGKRDGRGRLYYKDPATHATIGEVHYYSGTFTADKVEGQGCLFLKDGRVFVGGFKNGQATGPGQMLVEGAKHIEEGHEDHMATVSKQLFIINSAARRYGLQIPENTHGNQLGALGVKIQAAKRIIFTQKIRSKPVSNGVLQLRKK